jgi:hypothetical protein
MTKVKVDKGVPMPESNLGRPIKYPWNEMEVGDSFIIKTEDYLSVRSNISYRNNVHRDRHFVIRKIEDGYRVWRDK